MPRMSTKLQRHNHETLIATIALQRIKGQQRAADIVAAAAAAAAAAVAPHDGQARHALVIVPTTTIVSTTHVLQPLHCVSYLVGL